MSSVVMGVVNKGVVVPSSPLPEGAQVEITVRARPLEGGRISPAELRRMPREQRTAILARAAALAEDDYRANKELTGFDAFSEEEWDDNDADSH